VTRTSYWQAGPFAATLLEEFRTALRRHKPRVAEHRYEVAGAYCRRTLGIARTALDDGDDALASVALANFLVLHDTTVQMRRLAPALVPSTAVVDRRARARLLEDDIIEVFDASSAPLTVEQLARRLRDGGRTVAGELRLIGPHVDALVASGHLHRDEQDRLSRTGRRHVGVARNASALDVLAGPRLTRALHEAGLRTIADVAADRTRVLGALGDLFASSATVDALVAVAERLVREGRDTIDGWPGQVVRPYQRRAHAALRDAHYAGVVLDAPAGSGKTLVGALCIVDWIDRLPHGQTVLVLAPSVTVQRQWVRELCYSAVGPGLAPHLVATGTVATVLAGQVRAHVTLAVVVMTYAALASAASVAGAFDPAVVERVLDELDVRCVLLDEAHVVADDPGSITAQVGRLLCARNRAGALDALVGLSATAKPVAERLARVGLRVVAVVDDVELVARGYLAPFAEAGVAFGHSRREQDLRAAVLRYRRSLLAWLRLLDPTALRAHYAAVDLVTRLAIAQRLLRLTSRAPDHAAGLAERLEHWEHGGAVHASDLSLVLILQVASGWCDTDLIDALCADDAARGAAHVALDVLRAERDACAALVALPHNRARVEAPGFGTTLDSERLRALLADPAAHAVARWNEARDLLATTASGAYLALHDDALHNGEGRVHTVAAIVEAERDTRPGARAVVFERGGALHIEDATATPGHRGLAGTFAGLLDARVGTVAAALPHEVYLPLQSPRLSARIAGHVRDTMVGDQLASRLVEQLVAGLALEAEHRLPLIATATTALRTLAHESGRAVHGAAVEREVVRPLRALVRTWIDDQRITSAARHGVLARLASHNLHLRAWVLDVVRHLGLAAQFDRPLDVTVRTTTGAHHEIEVVHLPAGTRRQLAHELVARLVDGAAGVPAIDVLVVSSWARGGWNVITPDVLVDATATRDVVAWQQLRGRALRPSPGKVAHVYELLKGHGREPQVIATAGGWARVPRLAGKHRHELAADLRDGVVCAGAAHAGIVAGVDPRTDRPEAVRNALVAVLRGADDRIREGWMRAAAPGPAGAASGEDANPE
jgi:superfamily II DNA or RNA helicase